MRIAPKLYQLARIINTFEALTSGNPKRIKRRLVNIVKGRAMARLKIFNKLYK